MGKIGIPRFIKPTDSFINKRAAPKKRFILRLRIPSSRRKSIKTCNPAEPVCASDRKKDFKAVCTAEQAEKWRSK